MEKGKYYLAVRNYLLEHLFNKSLFTVNRSSKIDSINDLKYLGGNKEYGEALIVSDDYTARFGYWFRMDAYGQKRHDSECTLTFTIHSQKDDTEVLREFVKELKVNAKKYSISEKPAIVNLEEFIKYIEKLNFEMTGTNIGPLASLYEIIDVSKLISEDRYKFLYIRDALEIKDNGGDFIRVDNYADVILGPQGLLGKITFKDMVIDAEFLRILATNFHFVDYTFDNCKVRCDADFSVLRKGSLKIENMEINFGNFSGVQGNLSFSKSKIAIDFKRNLNAEKIGYLVIDDMLEIYDCNIDYDKLFIIYQAPHLKKINISGPIPQDRNVFNMISSFAPNLECFNYHDNDKYLLYDYEPFIKLRRLREFIYRELDSFDILRTVTIDEKTLRKRNYESINAYLKKLQVNDIPEGSILYFEYERILRLSEFYNRIYVSQKDFEIFNSSPDLYSYISSSWCNHLERGYYIFNGFLHFIDHKADGDTFMRSIYSEEGRLHIQSGFAGVEESFPHHLYQTYIRGLGRYFYSSDGRIILMKRNLNGKYYTSKGAELIWGQLTSDIDRRSMENAEDFFRAFKRFIRKDIVNVCSDLRSIDGIWKWIERNANAIPNIDGNGFTLFLDFLNKEYSDTLPEVCRLFNEYKIKRKLKYLPDYSEDSLIGILYENLKNLSLAEVKYVFDIFYQDNFMKWYEEEYGLNVDLSTVDVSRISEVLGIDILKLKSYIKKINDTEHQRRNEVEQESKVPLTEKALEELKVLSANQKHIHYEILKHSIKHINRS